MYVCMYVSVSSIPKDRTGLYHFDEDKLCEWFEFVVTHNYFCLGPLIFLQRAGIPMGTVWSPVACDLFLIYYEWTFISQVAVASPEVAKALGLSGRYMDDINTLNTLVDHFLNEPGTGCPERNIPYIYPSWLDLKETTLNSQHTRTHFLDIDIHYHACCDSFSTGLFDKRQEYDIDYIRFPHRYSGIAKRIPYNIVTSQLHRFARVCNSRDTFVAASTDLVRALEEKGYSKRHIWARVKAFASRTVGVLGFAKPSSLPRAIRKQMQITEN